MENLNLVITLAISLSAAVLFGFIAKRIGLSPLIGYLLAGIVVGPNTPGVVANKEIAEPLSNIGVILLMFGVGLNFHVGELLSVWKISVPGAVGQSLAATGITVLVTRLFGWSLTAGIVLGLAISVASTVVLVRVLSDFNELKTPSGRVAVGWLVVEDIFTVVVLVLLPIFFGQKGIETSKVFLNVGLALLKIGVFITILFVVGGRFIPLILEKISRTRSSELFTLAVLVIAFGIAVLSAELFGTSVALGAFLAGMVVGRSDFGLRAATEALPMRDAFAVLFFVSIGMLFNPVQFIDHPGLVGAILLIILIGKPLAAFIIVTCFRYPVKLALTCAIALSQIGEFSFIMVTIGKDLHILPDSAVNIIVASAIISISLNPLLFRFIEPFNTFLARFPVFTKWINTDRTSTGSADILQAENGMGKNRIIIVGYGTVGKTLVRIFKQSDFDVSVIEMNIDTIHHLKAEGIDAVYGDALHSAVLKHAGIYEAESLIISTVTSNSREIIRSAKALNRKIKIIVRTTFIQEKEALLKAGAAVVFTGEEEIALAMMEFVLREMGATDEQVEIERMKFRMSL